MPEFTPENLSNLLNSWGKPGDWDLNHDGVVDSQDLTMLLNSPPSVVVEAQAMARWNFVPHQIFTDKFNIGVVSFHTYGIDRVEFFLDDATIPIIVTEPTLNPESNTIEYWISVNPANVTTGLHTVSAVAYPNLGFPRFLNLDPVAAKEGHHKVSFIADPLGLIPRIEKFVSPTGSDLTGNGSRDFPYASIMKAAKSIAVVNGGVADGGIISLLAGDHIFGSATSALSTITKNTWLTIQPAEGVSSKECPIVTATGGIRTKLVKFGWITIKPLSTVAPILGSPTNDFCCVWLDRCDFLGQGRTVNSKFVVNWDYTFITSCYLTDSRDGFTGDLVRDCHIGLIASDAFTGSGLVVNCSCRKIDNTGTSFHPDFYQLYAAGTLLENRILYNAELRELSESQGLFAGAIGAPGIKDIAFVNVKLHTGPIMRAFQFACPTNHMLVQGCTLQGPMLFRYDAGFTAKDIVFRDNLLISGRGETLTAITTIPKDQQTTGITYL